MAAGLIPDEHGIYVADSRYENVVLKCLYCGAYFKNEAELIRHIERAPAVKYKFSAGDTFTEHGFDEFPPGRPRKVNGKIIDVLTRNINHIPFYRIEWTLPEIKGVFSEVRLQTALDQATEEYHRRHFDCGEDVQPSDFGLSSENQTAQL